MYSRDKLYRKPDGMFVLPDGERGPAYAAYNTTTECWNSFHLDGTRVHPHLATNKTSNSDWHGDRPKKWVDAGTWVEYTPPINEDTTMNPIFGYQASNELNSDSWKQLVEATKDVTDDVLKDTFKQWETEFKEETQQPIPGAWRSAKSVIKNAREQAVPTLTVNELGERVPRGKTAVEKELKASKSLTKTAVITPTAHGIVPSALAELIEMCCAAATAEGIRISITAGKGSPTGLLHRFN